MRKNTSVTRYKQWEPQIRREGGYQTRDHLSRAAKPTIFPPHHVLILWFFTTLPSAPSVLVCTFRHLRGAYSLDEHWRIDGGGTPSSLCSPAVSRIMHCYAIRHFAGIGLPCGQVWLCLLCQGAARSQAGSGSKPGGILSASLSRHVLSTSIFIKAQEGSRRIPQHEDKHLFLSSHAHFPLWGTWKMIYIISCSTPTHGIFTLVLPLTLVLPQHHGDQPSCHGTISYTPPTPVSFPVGKIIWWCNMYNPPLSSPT